MTTCYTSSDHDGDLLKQNISLDEIKGHSRPVVVGLDWESDGWRVSVGGAPAERVSREDLLSETFDDADVVVVEQAHMRERDIYSVAQVYTKDELDRLAFRHKLRLFPGMPGQLAKAARDVGNVTGKLDKWDNPIPDKTKDAETMALYAAKHPARLASWKIFRVPDEDPSRRLWPARDELREDLREVLNPLRTAWNGKPTAERYELPEVRRFCALIERVYDELPESVREQFGIRHMKNGTLRVDRMTAALTVYFAVYTREGELRRNPNGDFIGIAFILKAIGMCNSYRPNMARSQLTYHGIRHYKGTRSEYMRNLRKFIQVLRDAHQPTESSHS